MLVSTLPAAVVVQESFKDFSVLNVLEDYENSRVVAVVKCGETQLPLVLWADTEYDQAYNWTNAAVIARVKELLPAALA